MQHVAQKWIIYDFGPCQKLPLTGRLGIVMSRWSSCSELKTFILSTGGLTAVIWTDFIQTIIMIIGAFILMIIGMYNNRIHKIIQ